MTFKKFLTIAGSAFLLLTEIAAADQQTLVNCTKVSGTSGWDPQNFTYSREGTSKNVTVSDPLILTYLKAPVNGKILRETNKKLVLSWKVKGVRDSRGATTAAMTFKATIDRSNMTYKVTVNPLGYPDVFTGRGKCAVVPASEVKALTSKIKSAGRRVKQNGGMLHSLWKSGGNRNFTCKIGQPRKAYSWSATQVAVQHKAKSKSATIELSMRGHKSKVKAAANVKQNKELVVYSWQQAVEDPQGKGFTEPAKAVVNYNLFVELKSGRASLQSSANPTRRKSSSRVPADCR
ncbi:hypothetical protein [uncultured Litoreibacter sp.]|uniref:hypothetical protein n=1 Tax=uncultured Litoreibacter sp. TaxID=1392394 RepID=UPI002604929F|nr:hypothetical protein [uncultured Litoreibacter sp.]